MKSSIKIGFNEARNPVLKINFLPSEDVRDEMVGNFLGDLPNPLTGLVKIESISNSKDGSAEYWIRPIPFLSLADECKTTLVWVKSIATQSPEPYKSIAESITEGLQYVTDDSPEFHEYLKAEGIKFDHDQRERQTGLPTNINLFNLGVQWGIAKQKLSNLKQFIQP